MKAYGTELIILLFVTVILGSIVGILHLSYQHEENMAKQGFVECPALGTAYRVWIRGSCKEAGV